MRTTRTQNLINLFVTVFAAGILPACGKKEAAPPPAPAPPPAAVNAPMQPAPEAAPNLEFEKLKGKWLRPDGGYILEIRSATAEGKLEASYFNPGPINVARSEWQRKDGSLQVFVELRDVNYPGSTYTLKFSDSEDRMTGNYFQASQGENFAVEFVRQK
jgi:hypothetical protein